MMAALFLPLIVKQEPSDDGPQKTFPDPASTRSPLLKVKLEGPHDPSRCHPILTSSQTCSPATPQTSALVDSPKGPECLHEAIEGRILEVSGGKNDASDKASAQDPAPDLGAQGGQMRSQPAAAGGVDGFGGEATSGASYLTAQDESAPTAPGAAAVEAEQLRENLRRMSEMMARLQAEVLATSGQTTEEFAEVQLLLEKNQSLLRQPLALEQGTCSKDEAAFTTEGALVKWKVGILNREGLGGGRGGGLEALESEPNGIVFEHRVPGGVDAPDTFVSGVMGVQRTDPKGRGALGLSSPSGAEPPVAATFANVAPAGGPSTPGKEGPVVTPQQESESMIGKGGPLMAGLVAEPGLLSFKGSVSGDGFTAGGVTAGEGGTPSEQTGATEGLHSSPGFSESPGDPSQPTTPAKTASVGAAESQGRELSRGASEVLSTAGPGAHEHSGVNGHLDENGHLGLSRPPALEPFDDDVGSGLENNDDGFDSEPEEAHVAEEEQLAVGPKVVPLLFAESDEEEECGSEKPDGVSLDSLGAILGIREESVCKAKLVKERVKETVKGPGKKHLVGGSKGKKNHGGKVRKEGRGAEKMSKATSGEATAEEQRAWKSYDREFERSFMRVMLPSHVTGGYWLGVPISTANRFMKRGQYSVTFESGGSKHPVVWLWRAPDRPPKNGEKSPKVKSDSRGFSGGWKGFARDHELVTGDAVVFERVCNKRFRLHLFRRNAFGGNVERAAKAANALAQRLNVEGLHLTGGQKKRALGGDRPEVGDGRPVGKQAKPVDVSAGGANGKGVPGCVAKRKRALDEGKDGGSPDKRRKVGGDERGGNGAKQNGGVLTDESAERAEVQFTAGRRLGGKERLVETTEKKNSPLVEEVTKAEKGPLTAEKGRASTGEHMEPARNKEKRGLDGEPPARGESPVGKRQTKVTECFPVVKRPKLGVSKGSAERETGRSGIGPKWAEERSLPAGTADVTAVTTLGREPETKTGGLGGGKRVKHTLKRGVSQGLEGKKRARDAGTEPPKKMQKCARGGEGFEAGAEERKSGTAEEPEAEYEGGRLVHYVDGGHRYVEAPEAGKDAARAAMERCASVFPSFRVPLSKSQTDKGFWLGGMTDFFRQNGLEPFRITALADARGRLWHARINSHAAALSGGWRGFALDHRLEVGDALVLALVLPYVFAVRIFKASRGGKEDGCASAGGGYEGQPVCKEERQLSGDQKKRLADILGLPGGLPSRNRNPPPSAPALPPPRKETKLPTPKPAPGTPLARADVTAKDKGAPVETASSAKTKITETALSGGSNGAPHGAVRTPPAVNRTWPVSYRTARALPVGGRRHAPSASLTAREEPGERPSLGASGPQASKHAGASGVFGPSGTAEASGKAGVFGGSEPSAKAEASEKAGVSSKIEPSGTAELSSRVRPSGNPGPRGIAETSGKGGVSGNRGAFVKPGASNNEALGKAGTAGSQSSPKAGASAKREADEKAPVSAVVQMKPSKVAFRVDRKKKGGSKSNAELMAERLTML